MSDINDVLSKVSPDLCQQSDREILDLNYVDISAPSQYEALYPPRLLQ